jgi:site-specific recombinase XerC
VNVDLRAAGSDYLRDRHARGYRLTRHRWLIASFLDSLECQGATTITIADALAFAHARPGTQQGWHAARLRVIRGFASYVHALDPAAAELIPAGLIAARVTRRIPYLYSQSQIAELMSRCGTLSPPLLAASMRTLIGLMAATGVRSGEAFALDLDHFCPDSSVMRVTGKYAKVRLLPLHASTVEALVDYRRVRAALSGVPPAGPLLVGARGGRLNANHARATFRAIANACDLPTRPGCSLPRLHDYADPRVMPTSAGSCLHEAVNVLTVSA